MSNNNDVINGFALGVALTAPGQIARVEREAARAAIEAEGRLRRADMSTEAAQNTSLLFATALGKEREEKASWRDYATSLKANLDARKMSEHHLLEALKAENINHPLGKKEGFEAHFDNLLAEQYADQRALREKTDKDKASDDE